jgi:stage V sporulation protein G
LRAAYCNQCGKRLKEENIPRDAEGRAKLYADIAHPINSQCREMIQRRVINEFEVERERAKQPGYVSRYDDFYGFDSGPDDDIGPPSRSHASRVEPAEQEPRGPHRPPSPQRSETSEEGAAGGDDFGAGIL